MQHPDSYFMEQAIRLSANGRPLSPPNPAVGCVIVRDGEIIASGFTQKAGGHHAEIEALTDAEKRGVNIEGATVYVTLEPCPMCTGAIAHARIARVVFGASDEKAGAFGSATSLSTDPALQRRIRATHGVCAAEAAALLRNFFDSRRTAREGEI